MRKIKLLLAGCLSTLGLAAQETFPVNGIADNREGCYAFTHATIYRDGLTPDSNAVMVIRKGRIVAAGKNAAVPKDAIVIDLKGKSIYPSFIDIYSDYGITEPVRAQGAGGGRGGGGGFGQQAQIASDQKGAFGWNQAIKSDVDAYKIFIVDDSKAKPLRDVGFGSVLSHQKDGIARGTGVFTTLANDNENLVVLKERASAHYSLNKGTSTQSYPSSMMGVIALLRQSYIDAAWYKNNPKQTTEGVNLTLQAWNNEQTLPQIMDASDKWNCVRADRVGDEFGVQYIIKGGGNEYQRIREMKATGATFILPLNFPQAMDVEDPNDTRFVSLEDMKNWELAPTEPGAFEKAGIRFCLTAADLRDTRQFLTNLRKAIDNGLSEKMAIEALTKTPATILGVYDEVGSLEPGKLANFIVASGPLLKERTVLYSNWVQGRKYDITNETTEGVAGEYALTLRDGMGNTRNLTLSVRNPTTASVIGTDTSVARFSYDGKLVRIGFSEGRRARTGFRLSGVNNDGYWEGNGTDTAGNPIAWSATFTKALPDTGNGGGFGGGRGGFGGGRGGGGFGAGRLGKITYPMNGYGWDSMPHQETILIRNGTVWTNESEGRLENTDVLLENGKIARIGKSLSAPSGARVIDATGKHVTPGIIDEHSHIAAASINEGAQSVTSEVRIGDNLNPDDINIYRQLSGGVTTSHILHGSANSIGGQTQLIKLRWGVDDDGLKFKGADPFIKFALGENVKRTTSQNNNRFPDTRMGVEEVFVDAFQRARDYQNAMKADPRGTRRDLELDAISEIMNQKRFITCHSYVQSEITALMRAVDKFGGFRVNTFTHILEGYKVADKMKAHGANASTFSDWWYYKVEVTDAQAYNAAIMTRMGLNVCINSDDAEQARRLNQEAAKSVKYGGLTEEQAFKMVTLNPAKALHVDNRVGSLKAGKDADVVVWSDNPLSIYAKPEETIVDGTVYFDLAHDAQLRKNISSERNRLVNKLLQERRSGAPTVAARPSFRIELLCGDHAAHNSLITVEMTEDDINDYNNQLIDTNNNQ